MVKVRKASGELEDFSEHKVRTSLKRAGASDDVIDEIIDHIKPELYEGIPTEHIYNHIFDILKNKRSHLVTRYNLKHAIMELGPSGYPFEKFVAGVLAEHGYTTSYNQIMQGECVTHEIDVVAAKDGKKIMIECKFHNRPGTKSNIKTILYTYARFLDVGKKNDCGEAWLVTNTKVTSDVIDYSRCRGMGVLSWDYPEDMSLRYLVESSNLHPITALESLSNQTKQKLLNQGVVFVKDIPKNTRP